MSMLVTLNEMKSYLNVSGSSDDTFLTQQITLISDVIEAYCRREFALKSYVQTFYKCPENQPAKVLTPFHFPLVTLTSIEQDDETLDESVYRVHRPTGIITRTDGYYFFTAEETIVTYTAGYSVIPSAIQNAVFTLVEERYNKKNSGISLNFGSDVQRISIPGSMSIDFDYTLQNNERKSAFGSIIGSQANVLDHFRSERAVVGSDKLSYVDDGEQPPEVFGTYADPLVLAATDYVPSGADQSQMVFVKSDGGSVTITANPQVAPGSRVGQKLIIEGSDSADSGDIIILSNGNGLALNGAIAMVDQQTLELIWDGVVWVETGRN